MEETPIINESSETKESQPNSYLLPASVIFAGFLIAGAVLYTHNGGRSPIPPLNKQSAAINVAVGDLADDDPYIGNPEAPVTIVEFADFQCPFCARLHFGAMAQIIEKYVKTGKAKVVYRDFPLRSIHPMAEVAAEAGVCAQSQGKFWPFHDLVYARQATLSEENLKIWAQELGLNVQTFSKCLDSGKYAAEVEKDLNDGANAGVEGTPGTFINGRLIAGAVPFADFEKVIEEELTKAH